MAGGWGGGWDYQVKCVQLFPVLIPLRPDPHPSVSFSSSLFRPLLAPLPGAQESVLVWRSAGKVLMLVWSFLRLNLTLLCPMPVEGLLAKFLGLRSVGQSGLGAVTH